METIKKEKDKIIITTTREINFKDVEKRIDEIKNEIKDLEEEKIKYFPKMDEKLKEAVDMYNKTFDDKINFLEAEMSEKLLYLKKIKNGNNI